MNLTRAWLRTINANLLSDSLKATSLYRVQITTLKIQKNRIRKVIRVFSFYLSRKPSPSPSQLLNKRRKRSSSPVLLELLPVEDPEL